MIKFKVKEKKDGKSVKSIMVIGSMKKEKEKEFRHLQMAIYMMVTSKMIRNMVMDQLNGLMGPDTKVYGLMIKFKLRELRNL